MKANRFLGRTVGRYTAIAPLIGTAATIYALYRAFQNLDASGATSRTAMEGIFDGLAATITLLVISVSLAAFYGLVKGRRDDDGSA